MKSKTPWIVADQSTGKGVFHCQRCGRKQLAPNESQYGCSFDMMEAVMKQFINEHKDCKELGGSEVEYTTT